MTSLKSYAAGVKV